MLPSTRKTRTRSPPGWGRYDLRPIMKDDASIYNRRKIACFLTLTILFALAELFILLLLF
jgi:hypothetical protein